MPESTPINDVLSQELLEAVRANNEERVKQLLLREDVDVNVQGMYGNTPLHNICETQSLQILKAVLAHPKININLQNKLGSSPFHYMCSSGSLEQINMFLKMPALNINVQNLAGETPLHWACLHGADFVALLLMHPQIDISLTNREGETPLGFAENQSCRDVVKLLENFKAEQAKAKQSETEQKFQEKLVNLSPNDIKMPENKVFLDECAKILGLPQIFMGLSHKQQSALLDVYAIEIRANDKYSDAIGQIVYATHKAEKEKKRQSNASQIKEGLCQNQRQ